MQILQEQKSATESTGTRVFAIGASCNGLIQRFHQPGEAAEPLSARDESVGVAAQGLFLRPAARVVNFFVDGCRNQANPAHRNFFVRPRGGSGRIDPQHNMYMVAHHTVGINADGKDLGKFQQALLDPFPSVFVRLPIVRIDPTQPGSAHASRDAVIKAGSVRVDE